MKPKVIKFSTYEAYREYIDKLHPQKIFGTHCDKVRHIFEVYLWNSRKGINTPQDGNIKLP